MTARLLAESGGASVFHSTWRDLLDVVRAYLDANPGARAAMLVDAPYSARTHSGHDSGAASANRPTKANGVRDTGRQRRSIDYGAWSDDDVCEFVDAWSPLIGGWFVSITDDVLASSWRGAYEANGRQSFAPLPLVETGATVRLTGDGPSSWTTWQAVGTPLSDDPICHVSVGRPRTKEMAKWGTLPGWYSVPAERKPVVGGKPLEAMRRMVRDYTRPTDIVIDSCCGGGTALVAARLEGRLAIGGDAMEAHAQIAAERIRALPTRDRKGTLALFGEAG